MSGFKRFAWKMAQLGARKVPQGPRCPYCGRTRPRKRSAKFFTEQTLKLHITACHAQEIKKNARKTL